jgi:HEAT repeat protein
MEDFTELVKTLKAYDWGKSGAPLLAVDAEIRKVAGMPERQAKLEAALVEVLKSDAPAAAKRGVCKSLSLIATDQSLPTLIPMLRDTATSDMARYVVERMTSPAADAALRESFREARGRLAVGIVNSIGNRRDARALNVLGQALADADEFVAEAAACALGKIGGPDAIKRLAGYRRVARSRVRAEVLDAYLVCARRLASEGKKEEAAAMYKELAAEGVPAPVRRAAERALKAV